jgi:hypothetical protein
VNACNRLRGTSLHHSSIQCLRQSVLRVQLCIQNQHSLLSQAYITAESIIQRLSDCPSYFTGMHGSNNSTTTHSNHTTSLAV